MHCVSCSNTEKTPLVLKQLPGKSTCVSHRKSIEAAEDMAALMAALHPQGRQSPSSASAGNSIVSEA